MDGGTLTVSKEEPIFSKVSNTTEKCHRFWQFSLPLLSCKTLLVFIIIIIIVADFEALGKVGESCAVAASITTRSPNPSLSSQRSLFCACLRGASDRG